MDQALHVALSPDERYLPHGAAMLRSLFTHHRSTPLHVHLLRGEGLGEASVDALSAFVRDMGGDFSAHDIPSDWLVPLRSHPYYPKSIWLKVFAPKLIAAPRLLYLDCDLIIRADLSPLWRTELGTAWVAAVRDSMPWGAWTGDEDAHLIRMGLVPPEPRFNRSKHLARLGLQRPEQYFNVGVLLLDLDSMREAKMMERLLAYGAAPDTLQIYPEQDAFNALAGGGWHSLPVCWNTVHDNLSKTPVEAVIAPAELREARHSPRIFHFCGFNKPWQPQSRHPLRGEYIRARDATPWRGDGSYRQVSLPARLYLALPLSLRIWMYALPMRLYIWRDRLRGALHRLRCRASAALRHLPPPVAAGLRRLFSPLMRRLG